MCWFLAAAALLVLAGCGGSVPAGNPSACKTAMRAAYQRALASPSAPASGEPAACDGVPAATVSRYATQIMEGG